MTVLYMLVLIIVLSLLEWMALYCIFKIMSRIYKMFHNRQKVRDKK